MTAETDGLSKYSSGKQAGLGYRRESTEWVTVGTVPALWASIRVFIVARRSG